MIDVRFHCSISSYLHLLWLSSTDGGAGALAVSTLADLEFRLFRAGRDTESLPLLEAVVLLKQQQIHCNDPVLANKDTGDVIYNEEQSGDRNGGLPVNEWDRCNHFTIADVSQVEILPSNLFLALADFRVGRGFVASISSKSQKTVKFDFAALRLLLAETRVFRLSAGLSTLDNDDAFYRDKRRDG